MSVILGIGNILLRDEGVGVWVVRELMKRPLAGDVEILEAGVAGLDLLPAIGRARYLVIVDAMIRGGRPGSLYRISPGEPPASRVPLAHPGRVMSQGFPVISAHDLGVPQLLWYARQLGPLCPTVIFGIEPAVIDYGVGLSDELEHALPGIVSNITQFLGSHSQSLS
ncbi:MAG TPA: hydrogenase maturation protease [Firmicutes bacterium]|nr:hydrogenase maturation protease [Bacillota bacterium]